MKKLCLLLVLMISSVLILSSESYAYDTGTSYYGTEMTGYTKFYTDVDYKKGTRIPVFIGGTDVYTYYTYYVYDKLHIVTNSLVNDSFSPIINNELIGSYENVLVDIHYEYTMSSTIGYSPIKDASVGITFENHQSWDYTYSEGEEVKFEVENETSLAGVALMQIQMKIIERIVIVEKKYGGFSGTDLISTKVYSPTHTPYEFIIDYDLVPVFYNQLSYTERNNFEFDRTSYNLKLINSYTPNFNYEYFSLIPNEIRENYYY